MDKLFILGQHGVIAHRDILAVWLCLFQHYEECLSMDRGLTPPSPCYDLNAYEIITLSITILYIHQNPRITYILFRPRINIINLLSSSQTTKYFWMFVLPLPVWWWSGIGSLVRILILTIAPLIGYNDMSLSESSPIVGAGIFYQF